MTSLAVADDTVPAVWLVCGSEVDAEPVPAVIDACPVFEMRPTASSDDAVGVSSDGPMICSPMRPTPSSSRSNVASAVTDVVGSTVTSEPVELETDALAVCDVDAVAWTSLAVADDGVPAVCDVVGSETRSLTVADDVVPDVCEVCGLATRSLVVDVDTDATASMDDPEVIPDPVADDTDPAVCVVDAPD